MGPPPPPWAKEMPPAASVSKQVMDTCQRILLVTIDPLPWLRRLLSSKLQRARTILVIYAGAIFAHPVSHGKDPGQVRPDPASGPVNRGAYRRIREMTATVTRSYIMWAIL